MVKLDSIHNTKGDDKNMDTIKFKGSFLRTKHFMEGEKRLFENNIYNNVMDKYLFYLKENGQSYNTLRNKITNVILFLDYLEDNSISTLKKWTNKLYIIT